MVWNRQLAVNFVKSCILRGGNLDGLVIDEPDNNDVGIYLFNQCVLVGTALKLVGDPDWMKVSNSLKLWISRYQNLIKQNPVRNYFCPIYDQAVIPVQPSFLPNIDVMIYSGGPGTNTAPSKILTNTGPADNLSRNVSDLSSNRGLMRCLHFYRTGITNRARSEYDWIMRNRVRNNGFAIADSSDKQSDGQYRFSTYKQLIQWMIAKKLGKPRIRPELLNVMQQPNGKVLQFFYNRSGRIDIRGTHGNTEVTSLAIIADMFI